MTLPVIFILGSSSFSFTLLQKKSKACATRLLLENGLEDMGRGKVSCDKVREWHGHIYTTKRKIDS